MTKLILTIQIDDFDREELESHGDDRVWTATLRSADPNEHVFAAGGGTGRSPRDALMELVDEFIEIEKEALA